MVKARQPEADRRIASLVRKQSEEEVDPGYEIPGSHFLEVPQPFQTVPLARNQAFRHELMAAM